MKQIAHIIKEVIPDSIADELELEPGDRILSINNEPIEDVFDYHYLMNDDYLTVVVRKADGEEWELEIEKDYDEDFGVVFENSLMDEYRSCRNKCIFCFIDQMPKGMRETLYFKDDDSRLSFLQGNYVTLTNMSDHDIDRIIRYHLGPINISFHTMNPQLRCKMLNNRFAGDVFPKIKRLADAGIELNGQIVLCKNVNDGAELEYSLQQMMQYVPSLQSVSVVPVGLTKHREGLYPLVSFEKEDALQVIEMIEGWQKKAYEQFGTHLYHASDEWYILAGLPFPEADRYDGYLQLENGVGMMRLLYEETVDALNGCPGNEKKREVSIATGRLAAPQLRTLAGLISKKFPNIQIHIYEIVNQFFGEKITVSGLITGADLTNQLKDRKLGSELLLPINMLRSGEDVFLDDMTVADLENALQIKARIVKSSGYDLVNAVTDEM